MLKIWRKLTKWTFIGTLHPPPSWIDTPGSRIFMIFFNWIFCVCNGLSGFIPPLHRLGYWRLANSPIFLLTFVRVWQVTLRGHFQIRMFTYKFFLNLHIVLKIFGMSCHFLKRCYVSAWNGQRRIKFKNVPTCIRYTCILCLWYFFFLLILNIIHVRRKLQNYVNTSLTK